MAMTKVQKYALTMAVDIGEAGADTPPPAGHLSKERGFDYRWVEEFDNAAQLSTYLSAKLAQIAQIEAQTDLRLIINLTVMRKAKYVDSNT